MPHKLEKLCFSASQLQCKEQQTDVLRGHLVYGPTRTSWNGAYMARDLETMRLRPSRDWRKPELLTRIQAAYSSIRQLIETQRPQSRHHHFFPFLNTPSQIFKMDTLVAQYSKPMFEKENYSQDDQMELYQQAPSLSLKFAMPPVAQVWLCPSFDISF